jgi:type II secretory pathway pseudopilin PulG
MIFPSRAGLWGCKLPGSVARAFSLTEIVIAIGLVSFVLVAVIGLFSVGLTGVRESEQTIHAANLAAEMLNKRLISPGASLPALNGNAFALPSVTNFPSLPTTPVWMTAARAVGAGGYETDDKSRAYKMTYSLWRDTNSSFGTNSSQVKLHLVLSSPADAPIDKAATRYEVLTSFLVQ